MPGMEKATRDGIVVLTLAEEFTPELILEFKAHIEEALSGGEIRVLVDAGSAKYINSTAFGALVRARAEMRSAGGELGLAGLSGKPNDMFDVLLLGSMIRRFATVEEGLKQLRWVDAAPTAVPDGEEIGLEFRFKGHDAIIIAGADWHHASLETVGERELQFLWMAPAGLDLFRAFGPGSSLEVRTGLKPGAEVATFHEKCRVLNMIPAPEGAALVQVELIDPDDAFREAVREFVRGR